MRMPLLLEASPRDIELNGNSGPRVRLVAGIWRFVQSAYADSELMIHYQYTDEEPNSCELRKCSLTGPVTVWVGLVKAGDEKRLSVHAELLK